VLRAGFGRTMAQARQAVVHRHVLVDGKLVDRPSFRVKPGQVVQVKPRSQTMVPFQVAAAGAHRDVLPTLPEYLDVQLEKLSFELVRRPKRAEVPVTCDVQLVVEHYSRRPTLDARPGGTPHTVDRRGAVVRATGTRARVGSPVGRHTGRPSQTAGGATAMSIGDIAGLIAAIAFVLLVGALAVPLLKLGRVMDE